MVASQSVATIVFGDFEWDEEKAVANFRKHGVSFKEAIEVFRDAGALHVADEVHPDRVRVVGFSNFPRLLFVVYLEKTDRGRLRIISARQATREERRRYAQT